jgi:hypothetical protein
MENVTPFPQRRREPPPKRQPRIRLLGARMPQRIATDHHEHMRPDGQDYVVGWNFIAVRDRALVVYGPNILPPYVGNAAND